MAIARGTHGEHRRAYRGPAVFTYGYRPFFLLGACYAALAIPLWLFAFAHGFPVGGENGALRWHSHEMLYGYVAAIVAGFLLTAIPNWTGRLPVMGWPLAGFAAVWMAGRMAMFGGSGPVAIGIDGAFLVLLALFAWREVLNGKNWRNLPVCILATLFAAGNILFHAESALDLPAGFGERLGLGTITMLLCLIGGRIIPSFTSNWFKKRQVQLLPVPFNAFDKAILLLTAIVVLTWTFAPFSPLAGYGWLALASLHLVRLARWRGWLTIAEPLVSILHIAYFWLPVAFFAMGIAIVLPSTLTSSHALHALTAGAMGMMTIAVMTRASLGHGGLPLHAGTGTVAIYLLVLTGAVLRIALPFTALGYSLSMTLGGAFWSAGFLLFALLYGPLFFRGRTAGG